MPRERHSSCTELTVAGFLCLVVAACASDPVSLISAAPALPVAQQFAHPVAFLHSAAFRGDVRVVEPYGNKYYLPLKTGEASDRALRAAYAQVFAAPQEVASLEQLRGLAGAQAPVALIEPSILKLDYVNASGRTSGPFFAQITYRFSLADATGAPVASWRVRGIGQYDPAQSRQEPPPAGETAMLAEAPRLAVGAAAAEFVRGLERVPEFVRLGRNLALADVNVPADRQQVRDTGPSPPGVEASYPGALALQVQRAGLPHPPGAPVKGEPAEANLLAVRLTLHNLGAHRLGLDPADAVWLPGIAADGAPEGVSPLPAQAVSALVAGKPFGLLVGVMSPGAGMLPGLFAALVNASENDRQKKEFAAWSTAVERELLDFGIAAPGAGRSGVVYFARSPGMDGGALVIPVIDLDEAVRYTVRAPLPAAPL
jgi:hypothetical protein